MAYSQVSIGVKLHGSFSTDWSHIWLPYKGRNNKIRVESEPHMINL